MGRPSQPRRHNPYEAAIGSVAAGVRSVLAKTPPPSDIADAVEEFDRRTADPVAYRHEWKAIMERHGPEGFMNYVSQMVQMKDAWRL